jgi:hypothetical protein
VEALLDFTASVGAAVGCLIGGAGGLTVWKAAPVSSTSAHAVWLYGDDYFSAGVSLFEIPDGLRDLPALAREEENQRLAHER